MRQSTHIVRGCVWVCRLCHTEHSHGHRSSGLEKMMRNYLSVYISCFWESQPSVRPSIRASVRPSVGRSAIKFCKFSEWYRGSLCRQTKRCYRFCVLLKFESIVSQQNITVLRRLYVSVEIFCCFVYHSALQMGRPRK